MPFWGDPDHFNQKAISHEARTVASWVSLRLV